MPRTPPVPSSWLKAVPALPFLLPLCPTPPCFSCLCISFFFNNIPSQGTDIDWFPCSTCLRHSDHFSNMFLPAAVPSTWRKGECITMTFQLITGILFCLYYPHYLQFVTCHLALPCVLLLSMAVYLLPEYHHLLTPYYSIPWFPVFVPPTPFNPLLFTTLPTMKSLLLFCLHISSSAGLAFAFFLLLSEQNKQVPACSLPCPRVPTYV